MIRFILEVDNFLTPDECKTFIAESEAIGYAESLIRSGKGEVMNKEVRDNDRVIYDNQELADNLWLKIKDLVPQEIDGWTVKGLNERFRFYRYKDGQQFKAHIDGAFKRSEEEQSKITLLLYLNEEFIGGTTMLILEYRDIIPKTGKLLLFEHKIMHSGRPVIEGVKYVLRTDVMYTK